MRTRRGLVPGAALACAAAVALTACGARSHGSDAGRAGTPPASGGSSVSQAAGPSAGGLPAGGAEASAAPITESAHRPVVNHCAGNAAAQLVLVDLSRQHLWMCARHRTVRDTAITSGMAGQYTETPTGHYTVQGRNTDTTLTLNTGATYAVKYWIPFDAPLYGFHDSSWQDFPYGSAKYRTDGSHGCVHMPLKQIRFLYHWVHVGASVTIRA